MPLQPAERLTLDKEGSGHYMKRPSNVPVFSSFLDNCCANHSVSDVLSAAVLGSWGCKLTVETAM